MNDTTHTAKATVNLRTSTNIYEKGTLPTASTTAIGPQGMRQTTSRSGTLANRQDISRQSTSMSHRPPSSCRSPCGRDVQYHSQPDEYLYRSATRKSTNICEIYTTYRQGKCKSTNIYEHLRTSMKGTLHTGSPMLRLDRTTRPTITGMTIGMLFAIPANITKSNAHADRGVVVLLYCPGEHSPGAVSWVRGSSRKLPKHTHSRQSPSIPRRPKSGTQRKSNESTTKAQRKSNER